MNGKTLPKLLDAILRDFPDSADWKDAYGEIRSLALTVQRERASHPPVPTSTSAADSNVNPRQRVLNRKLLEAILKVVFESDPEGATQWIHDERLMDWPKAEGRDATAAEVMEEASKFPRLFYPLADWKPGDDIPPGTLVAICQSCDGDGLATGPPESRPCRRCTNGSVPVPTRA